MKLLQHLQENVCLEVLSFFWCEVAGKKKSGVIAILEVMHTLSRNKVLIWEALNNVKETCITLPKLLKLSILYCWGLTSVEYMQN